MPFDPLRPAPEGGFKVTTDVGYAIVTAPDEYAVMELLEIFVEPEYRHLGGGRKLVKIVREWGAERGAERLIVHCSPRNKVGQAFYTALGMRAVSVVYQQDLKADTEKENETP